MCGRMSLTPPADDLEERFGMAVHPDYAPRYNIAPGDDLDVVADPDGERMGRFSWGLRPHWVADPDDWSHPINARAETVAEKPSFRGAFEQRRCLVVADGFYEWRGSRGSKQPYYVHRADSEPFAFAGLWEVWGDGDEPFRSVTIITTEPNGVVEPIHDRMPVMLEPGDEARWLTGTDGDGLRALLDPYPADLTEAYEISTEVNDPANDSPSVVEPLGHGQSGLGSFSD